MGARPGALATMEFAPMASGEQRARRAGEGFLRLADDRRHAASPTTADQQLGATAVALLEGSPEGVAMIDASGTVVFWNAAAEQLFGLERSRAIGQELASLIFPDHLQTAVRAVLLRELDEPGDELSQRQIELGARRADGREIPVDIATTPIELAATRFLAIHLRDASERSERERELHSDARRRSAVLDLGQVALEGMALEQLLQRAVALLIDELGVDRCEVWKRDEGGETLTLRANVGWPEAEAGTQVPLATATQPGYTLLRGQGRSSSRTSAARAASARSGRSMPPRPRVRSRSGFPVRQGVSDRSSPPPRTCAASSSATSASSSRSRRRSARRSSAPG